MGDRSSRISISSAVYSAALRAMVASLTSFDRRRRAPCLRLCVVSRKPGLQLAYRRIVYLAVPGTDRVHQGEQLVEPGVAPRRLRHGFVQRRELRPAHLALRVG